MRRSPVELNGFLVILNCQIVFVLVKVAKPKIVIRAGHPRRQFNRMPEMPDRTRIIVTVVVEAAEPIGIQPFLRILRRERLKHRACPVRMRDPDVGHGQGELKSGRERRDGVGFLQCDGGIQIIRIQEVHAADVGQQFRRALRMRVFVDL